MNNNSNTGNEERDPKEALANRITYVILALLLVAVLTVTVVAIVATVSKRNDAPPDDTDLSEGNGDNGEPNAGDLPSSGDEGNDGGNTNGDSTPGDTGNSDGENDAPTVRPQVFVRPCNGYISKAYSSTVLSASTTMSDYRTHEGVDIVAELGAPVYALSDGIITNVTYLPMMGQSVEITHSNGIVSKYMNLSTELPDGVKIGAEISAGDLIGAIGETALIECAEQPHLHLEVFVNGKSADPTDYVTFSDDVSVSTDE